MHETSLVQAMLQQVDTLRRREHASRVTSIRLSCGEFSGVEPELFRSAYELLVGPTPMRGARLRLERVPLELHCEACGVEFVVERYRFECVRCGSREVTVVRGDGLVLESVTIEQPDDGGDSG